MQQPGLPGTQPQFSRDGNWWWDGRQWIATLSPDGRHRWTGSAWAPVRKMFLGDYANQSIACVVLGLLCGPMFLFGLFAGYRAYQELPWKRTQAAVGMILNTAGIGIWVVGLLARVMLASTGH
jgi:sensor c-di-GMP phosphodiesterase-like protein